jgi:uncharacterized membrane protein SpoIIM required for sporulation
VQEHEFVADSRAAWERLAASVAEARSKGVTKLGASRLRQMHEDYRHAAADLAYSQTHFPGTSTERYLNRLVGQAHGELYGSSPRRLAAIWRFLASGYPTLLRSCWRPIALSAAIMFGAALVGFVLVHTDYALARLLVPEQFRQGVADSFRRSEQARASVSAISPLLSAFIGVNNVWVALMAFAGGMTAGALTVYSLAMNGALIGVLAAVFAQANLSLGFWALIVPHGAIEIPAIVIAGGAGLRLAGSLVFPGDLPRMAALRRAAPEAVRLVLGTVPLFAIAALIEGFFTPLRYGPAAKLGVGALAAALLAAYWGFAGRGLYSRPRALTSK